MIKKERNLAYWSGVEVGIWHGVAYLAQAEALHTIAAGKVSKLQYQSKYEYTQTLQTFCSVTFHYMSSAAIDIFLS